MSFSFGEDLEKLSKQDTVELTGYSAIKFPHTHLSDESSVEPSVILENLSTDLISKNSATSDPSQNPWNTRTKTSASNLNLKTVAMHSRDTRLGNKENMIPAESKYTFRARSKRENSENMKSQFGPRRGRRKLIDQSKLNEISSIVLSLENSSRLTEDELTMNSVAPESDTAFLNKRPTKMVIRGRRKLRALFDNRSGFELSLERSAVLPAQVGGSVMFDVSDKFPSVTVTRSDESVSTVTGESALSVAAETGTEICKSVPNLNSLSRSASRDPTNPHVVEKVPNVRARRAMKRSTRVTLRGRRNLGGALGDGEYFCVVYFVLTNRCVFAVDLCVCVLWC
ncbi:hypothetical protein D915_002186 [Fasciola hepatica]|uniref:Uncharacterized protein n=1 Tax=Fasciola hepatica TaxID=6192 RepID=A0A4E0RMQ2_FASHE|nr:hypothetical protein D915_002186 [Fasciola hepatica]